MPLEDEVLEHLTTAFLQRFDEHHFPATWFDRELRDPFGLDVYGTPFPTLRGYDILEGGRARVLAIRLEDLDGVVADAFDDFLDIQDIQLLKANVGKSKDYGDVYRDFARRVTLPDAYLDRMYSSTYAQHFYTPDEVARFRARWTRPRQGAGT